MLLEGCIISDQLTLLIKIQPVLDRTAIQSHCLISKGIGDACFGKIIACIQRCLKICIITCHCSLCIYIRITGKIHRILIVGHSFRKSIICFLQYQLASLCLRNNFKLRFPISYIRILRCNLVLLLCTIQCFHLCFQLFLVKSRIFICTVNSVLRKTGNPLIGLLGLQKLKDTSVRYIFITNLVS